MNVSLCIAACFGLLLTIAGALGAHAIPSTAPDLTSSWDSALLFGFVHVLAAIAATMISEKRPLARYAGWAFLLGVTVFSLAILVATAAKAHALPGALAGTGALAPVGGVSFMIGWLLLVASAIRRAN